MNRRTAIGDLTLPAVTGQQDGMVGQAENPVFGDGALHRKFSWLATLRMHDADNVGDRLADGLVAGPAGQGFGYAVEAGYPALGVAGDDPIPNGSQGGGEVLFVVPQDGLLGENAFIGPAQQHKHQRQQPGQQHAAADAGQDRQAAKGGPIGTGIAHDQEITDLPS